VSSGDAARSAEGEGSHKAATRRPATLQEARALAHPLRLRILRLCLDRSLTNGELAAALERRPATVLHHVRMLLSSGFLSEEAWRSGPRGSTEKPYRATGKSARLDLGLTGEAASLHRAMLAAVAAEIEEAGPDAVIESARLPMRLTSDQVEEVTLRINALLDSYRRPEEYLGSDPAAGEPYAILLVFHRRSLPG